MDEIDKKEIFMAAVGKTKSEISYKIGFFTLIIFLIGFIAGIYFAKDVIIESKLKDSTRMGAIIISNKVFNLQEAVGK